MSTSDASAEPAVSRGDGAGRAVQGSADAGSGPAVTFATHRAFNLQAARALTVSEANDRATIYPFPSPSSSWPELT